MYISDGYQIQWWVPPRTASRMTNKFLQRLNFRGQWGHHTVYGDSTYDVYLNIRNPYSIVASLFFLSRVANGLTFEEFVRKSKGEYLGFHNTHLLDYIQALKDRKLKLVKLIRVENLIDDLLSIDFIRENEELLVKEIEELNKGVGPWRKGYNPEMLKPYSEFYTQELADIVYQNRKKYFKFGGYDKDSWKTLIN
jgi:hypothetical protein